MYIWAWATACPRRRAALLLRRDIRALYIYKHKLYIIYIIYIYNIYIYIYIYIIEEPRACRAAQRVGHRHPPVRRSIIITHVILFCFYYLVYNMYFVYIRLFVKFMLLSLLLSNVVIIICVIIIIILTIIIINIIIIIINHYYYY